MHKFKKKRLALGALGLLVVAGAAFAYFTTTGEGEGEVNVGNGESINVTATISGPLYPIEAEEAPTENATITLDNETNSVVKVQKVEKKEVKFDEAHESCNAAWFEVSAVSFGAEGELAPEGTATKKGAVWLKNEPVNQDACKGAEVTVVYKVVSE